MSTTTSCLNSDRQSAAMQQASVTASGSSAFTCKIGALQQTLHAVVKDCSKHLQNESALIASRDTKVGALHKTNSSTRQGWQHVLDIGSAFTVSQKGNGSCSKCLLQGWQHIFDTGFCPDGVTKKHWVMPPAMPRIPTCIWTAILH